MDGILLMDKPAGWTSFDVVHKVRRLVEQAGLNTTGKKRFPVGHTGTLDPLATGLLVLMLGKYTKKVPEYTKLDKTYDVTMRLGRTSTTGDEEGEKSPVSDRQPTQEEVVRALDQFHGESMQTPPIFSAIKVGGQRAYKLARKGEAPELKPRPITIYKIELTSYNYPFVRFIVDVSSGTYIRSLVEDLGKVLDTGAYMSGLRRTRVGVFTIDKSLTMTNVTSGSIKECIIVI
jgi:tRNA pseudouridine55 synthase